MWFLILILFVIVIVQGSIISGLKSRYNELHFQYINLDGWISQWKRWRDIERYKESDKSEAERKQTPASPEFDEFASYQRGELVERCPNCGAELNYSIAENDYNFCYNCGQALDWGGDN